MTYVLFGKEDLTSDWMFKVRTRNPELIKGYIKSHLHIEGWLLIKGDETSIHIEKQTQIVCVAFDESPL